MRKERRTQPGVGLGPKAGGAFSQEDYHHPAAAWGAAISVSKELLKQHELFEGPRVVLKMNHENGGFDCPGCAWPDDPRGCGWRFVKTASSTRPGR
jgi:hypothetical protein